MMNNTEREIQIQKLKTLQMINTYLSVGLIVGLGFVLYGAGWAVAELAKHLLF